MVCLLLFGVFDLMDVQNTKNQKWQNKREIDGRRNDLHLQFMQKEIKNNQQCIDIVTEAQNASHFAPTGKNPQSSRGHIVFLVEIQRTNAIISNFVAVDLAGSEGESALTASFAKKVCKKVLKTRRLEAGIINYGLSQLQKILSEIRRKKDVSEYQESGLRKVLHPYINKETLISVLFTLSPSTTNIKSTRSTLRVANVVSQIEIIPRTMVFEPTKDQIIKQLNKSVVQQRQFITLLQKQLNETKNAANIQNNKLETKQKALDLMAAEVNVLRKTESKLSHYADSLQDKLSDNDMTESELQITKAKLNNIKNELESLKSKERELDALNEAIDSAIENQGSDTIFDEDLPTDEYEEIRNSTQRQAIKLRVTQRFSTLIDEKEKQFTELTQKLGNLQHEFSKSTATILLDQQIIETLKIKINELETQLQKPEDIQLEICDSDHSEIEEIMLPKVKQQQPKKCCIIL